MSVSASAALKIEIRISDNKLTAWLVLNDQLTAENVSIDLLEAALRAEQVEIDEALTQQLQVVVEKFDSMKASADRGQMVLLQGSPAVDPKPEQFIWDEEHTADVGVDSEAEQAEAGAINYFKQQHIKTFAADMKLGHIQPFQAGRAGRDLLGNELRPNSSEHSNIELGAGLKRVTEASGDVVMTTSAGRVFEKNQRLWVEEVLSIPGDVDFSSGSLDSKVAIDVQGAVRANFSVKSKSSAVIHGTIEAADLELGGDVTGMKGIVGQPDKGSVRSGGTVTARFANDATIEAIEGIRIERSVVSSNLSTEGTIHVQNGSLVGGATYARDAIVAKALGNDASVVTAVVCGLRPEVIAKAHIIDEKIRTYEQAAEKIRSKVAPFMSMMKRLTSEQREKATELLAQADELDFSAEDLASERETLLAAAGGEDARVVVSDRIYAGVRLIFGQREVPFKQDLLGPVLITQRVIDGSTQIVSINKNTGSVTPLKFREVDLKPYIAALEGENEDAGS